MPFDPSRSPLAGLSNDVLRGYLTDAQNAYAEYMMGIRKVSVSYEGKSVEFDRTNIQQLLQFITMLQAQLGLITHQRRALRPYFK